MKSSRLAVLLLCSATLPAFAADLEYDGSTPVVVNGTSTNGATLYVGRYNPDNTLTIIDGGGVAADNGFIGQNSDNNSILVTGTNSSLQLSESLAIGTGNGNSLAVENGGWVAVGSANGIAGAIAIGNTNGTASLSMQNGATASAALLYVGTQTNESGSATLSGSGTELDISGNAYIGTAGSNNTVSISSGASMVVSNRLEVGSASSSNNVLSINSGGKLVVVNEAEVLNPGDNAINVNSGGRLTYTGDVNLNDAADRGFNFNSGSTLEIGGALLFDKMDSGISVILNGGLNTNLVSSWDTGTAEMYVGENSSNNKFTIQDGATATAGGSTAHIGEYSRDNAVTVTGSNSLFTVRGQAIVGMKGSNNSLSITNGGRTAIANDLHVGLQAGATGNEISVSGSNSTLSVGGNAIIGGTGQANSFELSDGQVAISNNFILGSGGANNRYTQTGGTNTVSGKFIIGETEDATGETGFVDNDRVETTGNLAMVGKDAVLNLRQDLAVGQEGGGSILAIRDGGTVNVDGGVVIGEAVGDNYIYLQRDADTRFNVASNLVVGKEGGSNRFAVYGGTADIGENLYLGASTNQHAIENFIHVETSNAVINVAHALHIGASNSLNTLDLVDGATVTARELFVGAYEGVSSNTVTVTGEGSLLSVSNNLAIGSDTGTNNTLAVEKGGTLFVGGTISVAGGSNNVLNINNNGTLQTLDWDFATISSNIFLNTGATLEVGGTLSGTNMVEGGIGFALNGTNALWDTGTNVLYVGRETGDNALALTNGAYAATATNLYIGYASENNAATIAGTGSRLEIGGDLFVGTETDASSYNTLEVLDGAAVAVDNDAFLFRAATLKIDSSSQVAVAGDYEQDGFSTLEVGISSNQVQPNLVVAGNAGFASSEDKARFPMIKVFDDGIGESNVVNVVQAKTITVDGNAATTGSLYDNIQTNVLLGFNITVSNGVGNTYIVLDDFITRSIGEAAGLEGQLLDVDNEIYKMKNAGDSNAIEMYRISQDTAEIKTAMNNYYGEKTSSVASHNVVNRGIASVASELTVRGDSTRARMEAAAAATPSGAAGPHAQDQQLQGWIAGYGMSGSKDAADGFNGYDTDLQGFVIGADLAVSKNILVGLAGGSNSGSADSDNGAQGDTKTTYGALYASVGTRDWFFDGSVIYGASSIDTKLGSVFDTTGSYDAQNVAFYFGGGKEIIGKYLIITPQASLLANYYKQDAYTEKSTTAVARSVDSFDALYFQSSVGCNLGLYTALGNLTLKPELRAHWLHEFNASDESLRYGLAGGTGNPYDLILQAPEEDILKIGAGVSAKVTEFLELRGDIDTRWGSDYSDYILSGSLRYQF